MTFHEPGLRAGFEPETEATDTLTRAFLLASVELLATVSLMPGSRFTRDATLAASDTGCLNALGNWTIVLQPVADPTVIAAQIRAFYAAAAGGPFLVASPWPITPLGDGFRRAGHPPFMVRAAGGSPRPVPPALRVERVATEQALADFNQTLALGFPVPEEVDRQHYGPEVLADPNLHFFTGYEGRVPVATAIGNVRTGIQHVESVATLPEYRGRGYGEAVTWAAATVDPSLPAGLIASDPGRPVYERMGFLAVDRWTIFEGTRADSGPRAPTR